MKFDRHIGSKAAEVPVKFQSDRTILNTNLAASRLYEILRKDVFSDIETGPWSLYYLYQLLQKTFYGNDSKITEFEMIDTKNSSTAYVVESISITSM